MGAACCSGDRDQANWNKWVAETSTATGRHSQPCERVGTGEAVGKRGWIEGGVVAGCGEMEGTARPW